MKKSSLLISLLLPSSVFAHHETGVGWLDRLWPMLGSLAHTAAVIVSVLLLFVVMIFIARRGSA